MRNLSIASMALFLLLLAACGGGSSSSSTAASTLSGNWQLNLVQEEPRPQSSLSISGFLAQDNEALTGSVATPSVAQKNNCGGVSPVLGTITGQNVTFSIMESGTTLNFTGTISSDNTSMSGDYQAPGGGCFTTATSGTWNAFLVPTLTGNFTGTIDSQYVEALEGATAAVPVKVSGSMTQSSNVGTATATVTGTINAVNYPCFSTASVSGTISGTSVYLQVFGYNGEQIGTIGQPSSTPGLAGNPAIVDTTSSGISLVGGSTALDLGVGNSVGTSGPCPPIVVNTQPYPLNTDEAAINFNFAQ